MSHILEVERDEDKEEQQPVGEVRHITTKRQERKGGEGVGKDLSGSVPSALVVLSAAVRKRPIDGAQRSRAGGQKCGRMILSWELKFLSP